MCLFFLISVQSFGQEYKLIFKSGSELPVEIFKSYQKNYTDTLQFRNDLKSLISELQSEGYLAASIDHVKIDSNKIEASVTLGNIYYWSVLDVSQLEGNLIKELDLDFEGNKQVNLNELNKLKSDIVLFYENSGYPFVQVQLNPFEISDSTFNASMQVKKGDFYTMDSLIIKGEAKISTNYIKKTLQFNPGEPFNQEKIDQVSKKINELSFLSEIKPAEIEFREKNIDLYLYLKKQKANTFQGIIGFLQDQNSDKLLITGELNLNLVNSLRKGDELFMNWEKLESSTQKLNISFAYPYFLKTNLGFDTDFSLYKKDSTYLTLNAGIGLRLFLNYTDYIKAYYRYKSSTRIGDKQNFSQNLSLADIKSNIFGASYHFNHLDYKLNPSKGIKVNMFAGAGFKDTDYNNTLTDSLNLKPDNSLLEVEAGLDLDVFWPIYKNFVFHFGNNTRYLDQFTDSEEKTVFFENELYRFGGAKSLRGFDENIFYASI